MQMKIPIRFMNRWNLTPGSAALPAVSGRTSGGRHSCYPAAPPSRSASVMSRTAGSAMIDAGRRLLEASEIAKERNTVAVRADRCPGSEVCGLERDRTKPSTFTAALLSEDEG